MASKEVTGSWRPCGPISGQLSLQSSVTTSPIWRCSSAHQAYIYQTFLADFKMSFRPNHPETCFPLPTGLGSSRRGGSCGTSLCSNPGGLGTAINNANTGECLMIYGMKPTEVHMPSPHRFWEPGRMDGLHVTT